MVWKKDYGTVLTLWGEWDFLELLSLLKMMLNWKFRNLVFMMRMFSRIGIKKKQSLMKNLAYLKMTNSNNNKDWLKTSLLKYFLTKKTTFYLKIQKCKSIPSNLNQLKTRNVTHIFAFHKEESELFYRKMLKRSKD